MMRSLLLAVAVVALSGAPMSGQDACRSGGAEQLGTRGNDRVIQKDFGDLRVCAFGRDLASANLVPPSEWHTRSPIVLFETQLAGSTYRLRLASGSATFERNGNATAIDSLATAWRSALFDVLNATWQLDRIGTHQPAPSADVPAPPSPPAGAQVMASTVPSTPGELSTLRAELDGMKAEWRKGNAETTSLQADLRRLQKDRLDEQRAVSDAQSRLGSADARERARINREIQLSYQEIRRIDDAIRRTDAQLRSAENQLATLDLSRRIDKVQRQLRELTGAVGMEPDPLPGNVERSVAAVDRQINAEIERNTRELVAFRDAALTRLRALAR